MVGLPDMGQPLGQVETLVVLSLARGQSPRRLRDMMLDRRSVHNSPAGDWQWPLRCRNGESL